MPVFFVLSGFVVHAAAVRSRSVSQYAWRRLTRIMPPYWASVVLVLVVVIGRKVVTGANDLVVLPAGITGWLATAAAMVYPATSTQGLSWVYWTLTYELAFYCVTALAVVTPKWFPHIAIALVLFRSLPWSSDPALLPGLYFLSQWATFGLGIGLSLAFQGRRQAGAAVLAVCAVAVVLQESHAPAVTALATAAFVALTQRRPSQNCPRPLTFLGEISYSLYLIHVPVGCFLLLGWKTGSWASVQWMNFAYDAVVTAICVGVSWLFFIAVEQPSIRLGRLPAWRWPAVRQLFRSGPKT